MGLKESKRAKMIQRGSKRVQRDLKEFKGVYTRHKGSNRIKRGLIESKGVWNGPKMIQTSPEGS